MVRYWFDSCNDNHLSCGNTFPTFVPTRLMDIGEKKKSSACLVETHKFVEKIRYAALSHCWGDQIPFKLLGTNLKSMKELIPSEKLSKTLKDAVEVVRALGMRYLWADTVCIIQDSKTDWQHEASHMGEVYRNSACSIAATSAANGEVGLFFKRDMAIVNPCVIRDGVPDGSNGYRLFDNFKFTKEVMSAKLNTRAWAFQELLLSPRTLHFTGEQIFYTCREGLICEEFPEFSGPPSLGNHEFIGFKKLQSMFKQFSSSIQEHDHSEFLSNWELVVEEYSMRFLTLRMDKLAVIGGLAKHLAAVFKDEYLAGIWRSALPYTLIWVTDSPQSTIQYHEYRAPPWSWAALDTTHISMAREVRDSVTLAEVLEINVLSATGVSIRMLPRLLLLFKDVWRAARLQVNTVKRTQNMSFGGSGAGLKEDGRS